MIQEIQEYIQVPIRDVYGDKSVNLSILSHLQKTLEGSCSQYGYVYPHSIEVLSWTLGKIITVDSHSKVEFRVTYRFDTLKPCKNDEFTCILSSKTKMGLLGFMEYKPPGKSQATEPHQSPLLIIIPDKFIDSIDSYQVGQTCKVAIVDSRIKYKSTQIQSVAKIL